MILGGYSVSVIEKRAHTSMQAVYKWADELGIRMRTNK